MLGNNFVNILREPCYPEVTHHHINQARRLCPYPQPCNDCRRVVQMAMLFVTKMPLHARQNCKIEIVADHFTKIFFSDTGYQENHFVFQRGINGEIDTTTMSESLRLRAERMASELWSLVKDAAAYIWQTIGPRLYGGNYAGLP